MVVSYSESLKKGFDKVINKYLGMPESGIYHAKRGQLWPRDQRTKELAE